MSKQLPNPWERFAHLATDEELRPTWTISIGIGDMDHRLVATHVANGLQGNGAQILFGIGVWGESTERTARIEVQADAFTIKYLLAAIARALPDEQLAHVEMREHEAFRDAWHSRVRYIELADYR